MVAQIDPVIHNASNNVAGRKLRQTFGCGKKFIVGKFIRVKSERSVCPQAQTGNFEEFTTRDVLIH